MDIKEVKYVWSWPIRIMHWFTFLSVFCLTVSGYYIAFPPDFISPKGEPFENFFMANLRFIHFLSAIVMVICFIVATYLIFFYKFHYLWGDLKPTSNNLKSAWKNIKFYFGFSNEHKHYEYMEPMAFLSVISYTILGLILIFTGLAMYIAPRVGISFWYSFFWSISGWTVSLFGNFQNVRIVHHFSMWLLLGWFVIHVYFQIWKSIRLKQYDISAIIGGYKFLDVKE